MSSTKRPEFEDLVGFGMDFIHQAGEKAMVFYGKGRPQVKFDQAVVTEAEIQLTDFFQTQLHHKFPEHRLFSYDEVNQEYSHEGKRYLCYLPQTHAISYQQINQRFYKTW